MKVFRMCKNVGVTLYTDDSQEINKKIKEREVIIATNLPGRGTDLITNEVVENNGGLHVIVTFLPKNIRIQESAFGRTGRQGRKGTARLIVQTHNSEDSILIYKRSEEKQRMKRQINQWEKMSCQSQKRACLIKKLRGVMRILFRKKSKGGAKKGRYQLSRNTKNQPKKFGFIGLTLKQQKLHQ